MSSILETKYLIKKLKNSILPVTTSIALVTSSFVVVSCKYSELKYESFYESYILRKTNNLSKNAFQILNKTEFSYYKYTRGQSNWENSWVEFKRSEFKPLDLKLNNKQINVLLPSQISDLKELDNILSFVDKKNYKTFQVSKIFSNDLLGELTIEFENILNKQDKRINVIRGFLKEELAFIENETSRPLNDVGILTKDSNNINYLQSSGSFINFLKDNDSKPTKWFLLTTLHSMINNLDKESFELTVFNKFDSFSTKAKIIMDGRNLWNYNSSKLQMFLPNKWKGKELGALIDFAILEVNFPTYEIASKFVGNLQNNKINDLSYNSLYRSNFDSSGKISFTNLKDNFDLSNINDSVYVEKSEYPKNNVILYSNKWFPQQYILKKDFDNQVVGTRIVNSLISGNEIFEINGQLFANVSTSILVPFTDFPEGSSGIVTNFGEIRDNRVYIKTSTNFNRKAGVWLPSAVYNFDSDVRQSLKDLYPEKPVDLLDSYNYNIFVDDPKITNQTKNFTDVIKTLYPNDELGIRYK